jgi:DNA-binding SARP family transcriptional activator/tetratricopeptide (TPR) repeat protein
LPGRLDLRVLGPVAVYRDGEALPLRGGKGRAVLALLALHAGRVVSADTLVESLWGEIPTPTARTGLQIQISKLRKLVASDDVKLETLSPGYVLTLDLEQIDLFRFEDRVEGARSFLANGDPARARELLDEALNEWRGEPLQGIDAPGLDEAIITDLSTRRRTARIDKVEAELALGAHRDTLPALELLMREEPLDERVHALAATALYRSGRQADALDVLSRLRRALSQELGIEAGPAIADLETRILRHDAGLEPPAPDEEEAVGSLGAVREGRKTVTALVCRLDAARADGGPLDPEARDAATVGTSELVHGVLAAHGAEPLDVPGGLFGAVFGIPKVHEDDVDRAVRVAAQLLDLRTDDDENRGSRIRLEVRVGIATGEVLVEDTGRAERLLSAGPMDEASQLVRSARAGEILISDEATRRSSTITSAHASELLVLTEGAPPTLTHRLTDAPEPVVPRHRAPLVGRQEELAVLRNAYDRVRSERSCSLVTVLGPAGVGKSRLLEGFLGEFDGARVLRGRCLSYGRDMTLWPIIEILSDATGVAFDHPSQRVRKKLAKLLEGIEDADFVERQLSGLLGMNDPPPAADELSWAIRRFFEALAREQPVIAIIEDGHWADAALLDLIEHVATWTRDAAVMLIVASRPELLDARPAWGGGRFDATTLALQPLSERQSEDLLRHLAGEAAFTGTTQARILAAAEGNPLFLEEVLAMATDPGALVSVQERSALDLADVPIPPTVQAILEARLDRLPPDLRRTLERAAVIGKEFTDEDLRSLISEDERSWLPTVLDGLASRDLIALERVSPGLRTYAFRHILIRDAAEAGAPKRVRARDHERFGRELERRAGERLAEVHEIIGYHLETAHGYSAELNARAPELADLGEAAAGHLFAAGVRAHARADAAAMSLLGRAVALTPEGGDNAPERWRMFGLSLLDGGLVGDAEEAFASGMAAAEANGDDQALWRVRVEQADLWNHARPESFGAAQAEAVARLAISALEPEGDTAGVARAKRLLGDALMLRGRQEEAATVYTDARRLALEVGDEREAEESLSSGAVIGQVPVERCLEILGEGLDGRPRPNPNLLAALGLARAMAGDAAGAREALDQGLSVAMELGAEWRALSVRMYSAVALLVEGAAGDAETMIRPAVEGLQRMGDHTLLASAGALLAEALWRSTRADEAMLATVLSEGVTAEDDLAAGMAWRGVRAKILADRGESKEAVALARAAAELGANSEFLLFAGWAFEDLAYVLDVAGKPDEARAARDEARALYEQKGSRASLAHLEHDPRAATGHAS